MKTYQVQKLVALGAPLVLKLTAEQAARRKPWLEDLGEGRYRPLQPMQFKAGETVGIEGEIPKVLLPALKEAGKVKGAVGKAVEAARALI